MPTVKRRTTMRAKKVARPRTRSTRETSFQLGMSHIGAQLHLAVLSENRKRYESFGVDVDKCIKYCRRRLKEIESDPLYLGDQSY